MNGRFFWNDEVSSKQICKTEINLVERNLTK